MSGYRCCSPRDMRPSGAPLSRMQCGWLGLVGKLHRVVTLHLNPATGIASVATHTLSRCMVRGREAVELPRSCPRTSARSQHG